MSIYALITGSNAKLLQIWMIFISMHDIFSRTGCTVNQNIEWAYLDESSYQSEEIYSLCALWTRTNDLFFSINQFQFSTVHCTQFTSIDHFMNRIISTELCLKVPYLKLKRIVWISLLQSISQRILNKPWDFMENCHSLDWKFSIWKRKSRSASEKNTLKNHFIFEIFSARNSI